MALRSWLVTLPVLFWMSAVMADPLPDGGVTVQDIAQVLHDKGYKAEIGTDRRGDPLVHSAANGANFQLYFYECSGKPRCRSVQFAAGFSGVDLSPDKVAEWNRTRRFGRVYLDKDDDPWVEMDVDLEHGATTEAIANDLERWTVTLSEFMKFINL